MVVVLPAPLGPRKPWTSPALTPRSRPSSARVGPKLLVSPATVITSSNLALLGRAYPQDLD